MASIRTLPSGNFQAAVLLDDGRRDTKTFPEHAEALEWAIKREEERDQERVAREMAKNKEGEWDFPTTPAASVEEAAQRFLDGAVAVKEKLLVPREPGKWGLQVRLSNEMILRFFNMGYQMVTGGELPEEYQLERGEHFAPDGNKVNK